MKKTFYTLLLITLLFSCSSSQQSSNIDQNLKLLTVIYAYQDYNEQNSPLSYPEISNHKRKLPNLSFESLSKQNQALTKIFKQLDKIDQNELTEDNQINYAVLAYRIQNELDNFQYNDYYMPLTAEYGFHAGISAISGQVTFKNKQDYLDYFERLKAIPNYFKQQIGWMKKGIDEGITQPQVVLNGFENSIKAFIKKDPTQSVYYKPLLNMPTQFSIQLKNELQQQAQTLITTKVMPSYQKFYHFMVSEYQPQARQNIAATSLPNGKAFYNNRVKHYTTLDLSPEETHEIGLTEVKRIRAEMMAIIKKLGFKGNFAEFIKDLRTNEKFYAKTPEELLKQASYIAKKMDAKLPSLFKTLPRKPYGVAPVPKNIAPKYTTGRYVPPSRDDQPGTYWVNTYRLDRRPLYVLEALTLHEAVPGHHLQGSLAREMENVPKFRNNTYISAFGEGWGLYSEYLGKEAGFYQDEYSEFGRLTYEMWRACRLVVDTGMHAMGWSRQRAIDFLASNTALSLHNVTTEIDRYISWPGQALSYKIGELTIKRLRQQAEQQLGENFDLREFHDQILKNGSMPLSMLEKVINQYIAGKLKNTKE